ncbi:MAG: hypothetical protein ACP5G7_11465 [Anaerolineae bacterium]
MKDDVRYIVRGAVVGAVLGAVAGMLLSSLGEEKPGRPGDQRPMDTGRLVKLGANVLGVIRQLVEL